MKDKKKYKYELNLKLPWWIEALFLTIMGFIMASFIAKGIMCPTPLLTP